MTAALRRVDESEFLLQIVLSLSKIMACGYLCGRFSLLFFFSISRGGTAQHGHHYGKLAVPLEGHWHAIT